MAAAEETNPNSVASPSPSPSSTSAAGDSYVPIMSGSQTQKAISFSFPTLYSPLLPGTAPFQDPEEQELGPGIYAIETNPLMRAIAGLPSQMLTPITYNIPTRDNSGAAAALEQQGQEGRQPNGFHRQVVVRNFHFAFHLDLALIIKLAAIVFLFSQDGSKERMVFLVFFAVIIYLHQTGALLRLLRFLQRQAGARPPQPHRAVENRPPAANNAADNPVPDNVAAQQAAPVAPEAVAAAENRQLGPNQNDNQDAQNLAPLAENGNRAEDRGNNGIWMGLMKEIRTIVVGFVASLFPGFQHND